jgi:hypothetical protein
MYLQEQRILYYGELLGMHRPEVKLKLEAYKRFPNLAGRIESELLTMLAREGHDLNDLPRFPGPAPEDLCEDGIHIGYYIEKESG